MERSDARRTGASRCLVAVLFALLASATPAHAQAPANLVSQIRIEGNQRVEDDAIRIHIQSRPGEPLNESLVDRDIKALYKMGFFETVGARLEREKGALTLVYRVKERPMVSDVKFEGMKAIRTTDDKIVDATKLHAGSILDPQQAEETIKEVKNAYEDKGYLDASVTFDPTAQPDNQVIAVFKVNEGPQIEITRIEFTGNKAFPSKELRMVMETGTHNLLSIITGAGILDRKKLEGDADHLTAYYYDNGYLNVHIGEPEIIRHGNSLTVRIHVDEGEPYKVGTVQISGDLKFPEKDLHDRLTLKPGTVFRGSTMQHDVLGLSDFFSNRGYAFVNVDPRTRLDPTRHLVDLDFAITPGQLVLVDRIRISGNTKTSDKVIRRALRIQEQEPYSAEAIRDSKVRLDRLGFFDQSRIVTSPASQPDRINLDVNVREGNTGSFQIAGGFSTASSVFGDFRVGDTNIFGGGESAMLDATIGVLFRNFTLSYTEPYFLDMPLTAGMELFDSEIFFEEFNRSAVGFDLKSYYPLVDLGLKKLGPLSMEDVQAGLEYRLENVGIGGVTSPITVYDIRSFKGHSVTSEVIPTIKRFTVNNPIDPRTGSVQSLTVQFAGLGGDNVFVKGVAHARFFFSFLDSPEFGNWVYSIGGDYGIGTNLRSGTGGELPLFERFFPGGVGGGGDVRGYELYRLGPRVTVYDEYGNPISYQEVGGSKEVLLSNEITFPILEGLGIRGVIFMDAGNSFRLRDTFEVTKLQAAFGAGIRWRSPFGPLRLELARPMNPRPGDTAVDFVFGAGSPL
ncbi:MAG: outer membrane protein assembly factor BamA [Candidatus Binataceae bacterium]